MDRTTQYKGLCTTCLNDPTCAFPREPSVPVAQCEEFSAGICEPTRPAESRFSGHAENDPCAGGKAAEAGLCCNCVNLPTCTFPLAGRGVQYCVEHRHDGVAGTSASQDESAGPAESHPRQVVHAAG